MSGKLKLLVLLIVVGVMGVCLLALNSSQRTGLIVITSPADTAIAINGKKYTPGYIELAPGKYTVIVDHVAFLPEEQEVTVSPGDSAEVTVFLNPDGAKGQAWLEDHPEEVKRREDQGSRVVNSLANQQVKSMPIIKDLPHIDNFYTVNYGASKSNPDDKTKVALYVRYYSQNGVSEANEWLISKNIDLEKTEIIYIDAVAEQE